MALGCNDATIPPYGGAALDVVHQPLQIPLNVFNAFNALLIQVVAKFGVNSTDQAAILAVLNQQAGLVVYNPMMSMSPPPGMMSMSICDRYSYLLKVNDHDLIYAVVNRTVFKVVSDANLVIFFNGQRPSSAINFLADPNALALLMELLTRFFGQALGCTDGTILPYTGRSMLNIHRNMGLTVGIFNQFNAYVVLSMQEYGVSPQDRSATYMALQGMQADFVPNYKFIQDDYVPYGLPSGAVVAIVLCAIVIAILVAIFLIILTLAEEYIKLK